MKANNWFQFLLATLLVGGTVAFATDVPLVPPSRNHTPRMSFIENRSIRLGVDLNLGGAITYLAPATNRELNVINSHDWGRQVQLSYYSGPSPFHPPGTVISTNWQSLGWNPIQSGDCFGFKSTVLKHSNTGHRLYTKLVPMQWPMQNVPGECECEVWLQLDGPVVKARCRLTNHRSDHTQYTGRSQELPAVYVNAPFHRLMTYRGGQPFTGGALSQVEARLDLDKHWAYWLATENWAAQVNDAGWGLGVWNPAAVQFCGGFYKQPGVGGPLDDPTGYIAPLRTEILDHNVIYDYRYELILGSLEEIRAHVYRRAAKPAPPAFRFQHDRQGWHYLGAADTGWPIRGELDVRLNGVTLQLISPHLFTLAEDAPKLVLEAAFINLSTNAVVFWRPLDGKEFSSEQSQPFAIVPDGKFRRYEINLASSAGWRGAIARLRLDFDPAGRKDARARLKVVALAK